MLVIRYGQCNECNIINEMQWIQYDECKFKNTMLWMQCDI